MKITILGGAGYVGSALTPYLLSKGHDVTVLDLFWYGDHLEAHPKLRKYVGDIRNEADLRATIRGADSVIHLACVSNDPSFDMNPKLGKAINRECFPLLIKMLWEQKTPRFVYASSSSVYGVSNFPFVNEQTPVKPLTDYSKFKESCEGDIRYRGTPGTWTILRPATVCGFAPRMRLDVVVNAMTISAIIDKRITVNGRDQKRPNINIIDMCRAYEWVIDQDPKLINKQTYNVGFENLRLHEIATLVKSSLGSNGIEVLERPNLDPRSYHIDSAKIMNDGFIPVNTISSAIKSIKTNQKLLINPMNNNDYHNIKKMKELGLL